MTKNVEICEKLYYNRFVRLVKEKRSNSSTYLKKEKKMDLLEPTTNSIDCDTNLTSQHDGVQKVISAMNHDPFLAHYNPYTTKLEKQ